MAGEGLSRSSGSLEDAGWIGSGIDYWTEGQF
jgi:hypothetical protein